MPRKRKSVKKKPPRKKYSTKAQKKIATVMREFKEKELSIGKSPKKVKSRKQALAIALNTARRKDFKVPKKKK